VMQGNQAEQSIVEALERIYPYENFFDIVVIIRGGGSQVDLSCFDNYNVAYHVTQFPLPVLTGIGHEKDDSIVDLVAHTRLKTPTAVAEFILDGVGAFEERINALEQEAIALIEERMEEERSRMDELARKLSLVVRNQLGNKKSELMQRTWKFQQEIKLTLQGSDHRLEKKLQRIGFLVDRYFYDRQQKIARTQNLLDGSVQRSIFSKRHQLEEYLKKFRRLSGRQFEIEKFRIDLAGQKAMLSDPKNILKKGYSITTVRGKLVKDLSLLKNEEIIKTHFLDGSILSKVIDIKQTDKNDN